MAIEGSYWGDIQFKEWAISYLKPRYLSLGIHSFVAFYTTFKFFFLIFNATDSLERWVFELTPFAILGFADLQLVLISASFAIANAFLHFSEQKGQRFAAMALTGVMVGSLILALRTSPYYFDAVNVGRIAVLGSLLLTVPLDHIGLLRGRISRQVAAPIPETEFWGPEAPEEFNEVITSVDEALGMLETSQEAGETDEELNELASDLLEDLLATISETPAAAEEEKHEPDVREIQRRRDLFETRLRSINQRLEVDSKDADALFAKATYLAMRRQNEEAIKVLDHVTMINPSYPGVWRFKAKVYQLMGNLRMAELCLKRANE